MTRTIILNLALTIPLAVAFALGVAWVLMMRVGRW